MSEKTEGVKPKKQVDAAPSVGRYDHELAAFKEFGPNLRKDMGYVADEDPRYVRNVPADMTVTWATDPRLDAGAHLSFIQGLGFRPVREEEVTTSFTGPDRMVLRAYEVGPHDYVVVGGGVLMIGYRQYRDDRRAAARSEAQARLDDNQNRMDNQGVINEGVSRSGTMSEAPKSAWR